MQASRGQEGGRSTGTVEWNNEPNFPRVPTEIYAMIMSHLPFRDLCRSKLVCKTWHIAIRENEPRTTLPLRGAQLWLDSTKLCEFGGQKNTEVTKWSSMIGDNFLVPCPRACVGRGPRKFRH